MGNEHTCFLPAVEMRDRIERQDLTATELVEIMISRMEKLNPVLNAYCTPTYDLARDMARQADARVKEGGTVPLLNGIPTSIKDLMDTKGIRTTHGSKIYEHNIPTEDDVAVGRLKNAGIVMLGKTNTPEFGHSGTTQNKVFGETKNPWDLERTPGGSSGGAAAACACGMSPLALGSDGGGSLRHPACFCGVFAIKPSFGRIPVHPTTGIAGELITHYGPISRYVEDAALMLDAMKGPHEADRYSLPGCDIMYHEHIHEHPERIKIAYSTTLGHARVIDDQVKNVVDRAVDEFTALDCSVEPVKMKMRNPETGYYIWYTTMYGYDFRGKIKKWREDMDPNLVRMVEAGKTSSGLDIFRSLAERRKIYAALYKVFKEYDILVTPTTAIPPFKLGMMYPEKINGKGVSPTGWMPFTYPLNFTGHPAATVPAGFTTEGLPVGMQIIGRRFDDLTVLQLSHAYEQIKPWQDKLAPTCE
ncbi:amidase [Candidatus Bathyarchaeota archaeon]|nr:amidase [Candidatus Bathyarchaeota archaeon]